MNNLYILCGIPGCGKSTYVRKLMSENSSSIDLKWDCVSRDQVRFSMIREEDDYFSKEKQVFNEFVRQLAVRLDDPYITNVIADATHISIASRTKLINAINRIRGNKPLNVIMVYFDIPLEVCKFRNAKRSGRERVPDEVLEKMWHAKEFPRNRAELTRIEIVRD